MARYIFAGNWKMNYTIREAKEYFEKFLQYIPQIDLKDRLIIIAPPFTALYYVSQMLQNTPLKLAAQNVHYAEKGAFTGEISPPMLRELRVEYAIIGHSERRHIFGEKDELISQRVAGAYKWGLIPILCLGETLPEREAGKTLEVVRNQLERGLEGIKDLDPAKVIIAYEPVWAIGTGQNATPEQAEEVHSFLRESLRKLFGERASAVPILYGGSVTPENVASLMAKANVDGVLVGGASLDPEKFFKIVSIEVLKESHKGCSLPDYSSLSKDILEIPQKYKRLVIVGASPKPDRPSYIVMEYLLREGFQVIPVNPRYPEILGQKTFPDLESIPSDFSPEVIIIFRKSSEVFPLVERALKLKPKVIWMQEGIENEEAKTLAESQGIKVVMNKCFKKVHQISKWNI